jgi:deoxyribose-phosphate aldolase
MYTFKNYSLSEKELVERIDQATKMVLDEASETKALKTILNCIDLTTLEGSDTKKKITELCHKARNIHEHGPAFPNVAAVCFYPPFVSLAKTELNGSSVHVASVAGAFPAGQSPLQIKLEEVKYAVNEGADEIDMVISRGKFLERDYDTVFDEIAAIKNVCGRAHLKVILETGELHTISNIRKASEIAILAGADFIKTSTGKIQPAASLEALMIMADTVKEFYDQTGKIIGLKPAGGISTCEQALKYFMVVKQAAGDQWLNNTFFRIGASRLTDQVIDRLHMLLG